MDVDQDQAIECCHTGNFINVKEEVKKIISE
jgi:hypothetical protein